jgi:hypothetical protein
LEKSQAGAESAEIPDWLRDIVAGSPAQPEPAAAPQPPPPAPDEPDADVPDWLRTLGPPDSSLAAPPPAGEMPAEADAMPDWLRDVAPTELPAEPEPFTLDEAPAATPAAPSWLDEAAAAPPEAPSAWLEEATLPADRPAAEVMGGEWRPPAEPEPFTLDEAPGIQPFRLDDASVAAGPTSGDLPPWLADSPGTTEVPTEDLPPWLRGTSGASEAPAEEPAPWLASEPPTSAVPDVEQPAPAAPDLAAAPAETEGLPAWLHEAPPSAAAAAPSEAEELPAWLREEPPAASSQAPSDAAELLPPWVRDEPGAAGVPAPSAELAASAEPLPDWLRELPLDAPLPTSGPEPAPDLPTEPFVDAYPPSESGSLPAWLAASDVSTEPAQPGLPAWLSDAPTTPEPPAPAEALGAASTQTPDTLPPWLHTQEEQQRSPSDQLDGPIELPAWLRAETSPQPSHEQAEASRSLDWLSRLRQQDDEGELATSAVATTTILRPPVARRPVAPEAVGLMQQLRAEPFPRPVAAPAETARRWRQAAPIERLLAAVLLLGTLLAVLMPGLASGFAAPVPQMAGSSRLHSLVDGLDERSVVVLAYEWDARRAGELEPLERSITDHLITKRAGIVTLSTDPQGALLSFNLRDRLRAAGYGLVGDQVVGGVDDLFLGYLPGGELALRGLVQDFGAYVRRDFAGNDTSESAFVTGAIKGREPLTSIQQVSLIVVVADEAQDVQGWVEQVRSRAPQVPMALIVPSESGPFVRPYLTRGELLGANDPHAPLVALIGAQEALAYRSLSGGDPALQQQLQALVGARNLGLGLFVLLVLVGGLASLARRDS